MTIGENLTEDEEELFERYVRQRAGLGNPIDKEDLLARISLVIKSAGVQDDIIGNMSMSLVKRGKPQSYGLQRIA
jgi:hypothetical protein